MKINRVMLAAPKSGSGKTTAAIALLGLLKKNGVLAASFKCGPDYIDPMFHEKAIGIPAKNLDTFFTGEEQTKRLFLDGMPGRDFAVFEGVMGLYDGLGGVREEGSSYHLAKVTKTPVVLVVDAKGMGRSVIPLIAGFLSYDTNHLIRGVLLNRISKGYYEILKPLIEKELKITVTGYLPEQSEFQIASRHLGLVLPDEREEIRGTVQTLAEEFEKTVSLDSIMEIAKKAEELKEDADCKSAGAPGLAPAREKGAGPVIAVARDEAFCFYYKDNLRLLGEYGAELAYFSPLHDESLPSRCHALLIGGGYPELYAEKLAKNGRMRAAVKAAAENGMPIVAECGGFLYLHSEIAGPEGVRHEMAGVIPAVCFDTGKLARFGYVEIREKESYFLPKGASVKGHEFHYYDSSNNGNDAVAAKPVAGREYSCVIENENQWMGFPHLYYPSNPAFAESFVRKAEKYKERMAGDLT